MRVTFKKVSFYARSIYLYTVGDYLGLREIAKTTKQVE